MEDEADPTDYQLVSSRFLTTFSDYRLPEAADFLLADEYCAYLEGYCKDFNLWPSIRLSTSVTKVERVRGGGHIVHYIKDGEKSTWPCDAVAICSGLHVIPNMVSIPGLENVPVAFHSSEFKNMAQLGANQNLLIVGSGETGMDLAYLAVTSDKSVTLCHRDGKILEQNDLFVILTRVRIPCCSEASSRASLVRNQCQLTSSLERSVRCGLRQSVRYSLCAPTPSGLVLVCFALGIL